MAESTKPPKLGQEKRTVSGQTPAVQAFRKKLDSFQEGTLEEMARVNEEYRKLSKRPVKQDDRREPQDGDPEIPVDVFPPAPPSIPKDPT